MTSPIFILLFLISLTGRCLAAPVSILLRDGGRAASDLTFEGKILSEQEAYDLTKQNVDLSTLNPDENTDYWKEDQFRSERKSDRLITDSETPVFKYVNSVKSEVGTVRLTVSKDGETFLLQFSRANHRMLMRKALLEKLGFNVAPVQWLKKAKLKIDPGLVEDLKKKMVFWTGEPKSWITEESKDELILQDTLLFESSLTLYHLATGFIPGSVRRTRLFNSLPIAYSLLEYPDTGLDQFSWNFGTLAQDRLHLDFNQNISNFSPTYDDARWIGRLISELSREDFEEIVAASEFPRAVQEYLVEKLISRRNSMVERLRLEAKSLPYEKSMRIESAKFVGYADTFLSSQPEAPLSRRNLIHYGEALLQSSALTAAIDEFNERILPNTDLGASIGKEQFNAFVNKIKTYLDTGVDKDIPFGAYVLPYGSAKLILSRDVITGSYMGSKNLIQKADSFGFSVQAGAFVGFHGLPVDFMASITGDVFFNRVYTHIRPLREMKAVFTEPYLNIFVETKRRNLVREFDKLIASGQDGKTPTKENLMALKEALDKVFPAGDSLVMTDSLGSALGGEVSYGFHEDLRLTAGARASGRIIRRINVLRSSEKLLQIYVDDGRIGDFTISVNLDTIVPVISLTHKTQRANVDVRLFELNLDVERDTTLALKEFSTFRDLLDKVDVPEGSNPVIQSVSGITSRESSFRVLGYSLGAQNARYDLKVSAPAAPSRKLLRLKKVDYEDWDVLSLGEDAVNAAIDKFLDTSYEFNVNGSAVSGENLLGKSRIFDSTLDAVSGEEMNLSKLFYTSRRIQKKWLASNATLVGHVAAANAQAGAVVFDPLLTTGIDKVQFYTMQYQTAIYADGIGRLLDLAPEDLLQVMKVKSNLAPRIKRIDAGRLERLIGRLQRALRKINEMKNTNPKDLPEELLWVLVTLDKSLTFTGLQKLVGKHNIALIPSVYGFKDGDRPGFDLMRGNILGRIAENEPNGPIMNILLNTRFLESELVSTWLVRGFQ